MKRALNNPFVTNGYEGDEYFCDRVEETPSSAVSAVKGLLERDFITEENGTYRVYDKFFALWLKRKGLL